MPTHPRLTALALTAALALTGCSRGQPAEPASQEEDESAPAKRNEAAMGKVRAGARALAQPGASIDYVAAEMQGVIKARTQSQALMYYDGYRVTMTTPGDRVTRITFHLLEAKPTVGQLTEAFGKPQEHPKGLLYRQHTAATGSTILILAEPDAMPADDNSPVRRIIIEGARTR